MSGGGSFGLSGQKSKSGSNFSQDVWGPQGGALEDLYSRVGSLFDTSNRGMQGQIPGAVDWMNDVSNEAMPAWQKQMAGGAYKDMDLQNQLMGSLTQAGNKPSATSEINAMMMGGEGNNYADAMKSQYMEDASKAQDMMLANTDARAAASGMSGGSRHGVLQAKGMEDINSNLMSNMARTGYETFDKDLDRKLAIAGQADQANLSRQGMMMNMLGNKQDAMSEGVQYGQNMQNLGMGQFSPYMAPWQASSAYSNAVGAPTVLGSGGSKSSSKGAGTSASKG